MHRSPIFKGRNYRKSGRVNLDSLYCVDEAQNRGCGLSQTSLTMLPSWARTWAISDMITLIIKRRPGPVAADCSLLGWDIGRRPILQVKSSASSLIPGELRTNRAVNPSARPRAMPMEAGGSSHILVTFTTVETIQGGKISSTPARFRMTYLLMSTRYDEDTSKP